MTGPVRPFTLLRSFAGRGPDASTLVPAEVLVRRYPFPQNAISVAFLTSRWKAAVPVPAGGGTLFL